MKSRRRVGPAFPLVRQVLETELYRPEEENAKPTLDGSPVRADTVLPSATAAGDAGASDAVGRIARSGVWTLFAHAAMAGSAFLVSIIVGRTLGRTGLGNYSFQVWLLRLVPTLLALGIPSALTRMAAEKLGSDEPGQAKGLFRLAIRAHAVLFPVPALVLALLVSRQGHGVALPLAILAGIAITLVTADTEALLAALRRFRALGTATAVGASAQIAFTVVGAALGAGWQVLVMLYVAGAAVGLAADVVVAKPAVSSMPPASLNRSEQSRFLRYALVVYLAVAADAVIWGRPELFFLNRYRGAGEVGLYSAALRLSSLVSMLPLVASRAVMPEFSWLKGAGHERALREAFPRVCKLLAAMSTPLALGGAAIAGPMVVAVYGPSFRGAATTTAILMAGAVVNAVVIPTTVAVLTGPRPRLIAEVGLSIVALNLVLDFAVIPRFGLLGAAAVNVAVQFVAVAVGVVYVRRFLGLRYGARGIGRVLLIAAVSAAIAGLVVRSMDGMGSVLAALAAGAGSYFALLFGSGTLTLRELLRGSKGAQPVR